jgi:microsomal dipeptidase-like Zn-dependent dipeptidase
MIARTGGVIGQFVAEDPVTPPGQLPFRNDCAGSSKSFAASLSYGLSLLKGTGLGIATDFTFIPGTSPRFGDSACWARAAAKDPDEERRLLPVQYDLSGQVNGVRYTTGIVANSVRGGANEPLEPSRLGDRTYDFNLDGFAHYGLLPDLLQDVKNIGAPREVLNALFSSAESYLRMWEKAERVSGGGATTPFVPSAVDCVSSCRGLCPQDPFAGAPH